MMEREDIRACRDNISKCILKALDLSLIPNCYFFYHHDKIFVQRVSPSKFFISKSRGKPSDSTT